jgi:hypothetical protein
MTGRDSSPLASRNVRGLVLVQMSQASAGMEIVLQVQNMFHDTIWVRMCKLPLAGEQYQSSWVGI